MIKRILLKDIATYKEQVEIKDIRKINFFYGSNGSGKTVLSKVISNPDKYPTCEVEWENNSELKTVVFNEDFVSSVFYQSDSFPGIYTIGEEAIGIENQIKTKNEEKTQIENERKSLDITLGGKKENLEKVEGDFRELCWKKIYQKYQNNFDEIFSGYKNSKQNFAERLLKEFSEMLKAKLRSKSVFDVNAMSLFSLIINVPISYFVCLLNSYLFFHYKKNFINSTSGFQINDARQLPIIIPNAEQLHVFENIFNRAVAIQKDKFSGKIAEDEAEKQLNLIQIELDKEVEELYDV